MTLLFKCYEIFCNTFLCAFLITLCSPQQGLMNSTHFCLVVKIIHKPFSELNFKNYRLRTVTYTGNIWQIKVQYRHSSQELKHKKQSWDYMCYCRTVLLNQVHSLFYLFVFFYHEMITQYHGKNTDSLVNTEPVFSRAINHLDSFINSCSMWSICEQQQQQVNCTS